MGTQLLQYHLLRRLFSTELCFACLFVFLCIFDNKSFRYISMGLLLGYLVLFHWSMCFPFFQHHTALIYICRCLSGFILGTVIPPTIFFFVKFVFAIAGCVPFCLNFIMSLSLQKRFLGYCVFSFSFHIHC